MKTKWRRLLSLFLAMLLVFSLTTVAFAAGDEVSAETEAAAEPTEATMEPVVETTEPVETEPTESTEETEPVDEVIRVTPLNLYDDGMMPFARYQLTKWGSYQIFPHTPVYIEWTFPDGSKPYLNGYDGYGDATFNYPHYMEINGDPAYCIFPGVDAENLTYTDEQALDTWENGFSEAQRQAIGLIVALGYGACDFTADPNDNMASTYNWDEAKTIQVQKYMATQILIWEIIVQDRSAAYPYTLNNSRLWDSFYRANDNWYKWPTMLKVRNEIVAKMQASTTIPSFASSSASTAPEIKLTYNASTKLYEATVTDANKVLANYNFSSSVSGTTFTRNGNTLKITATREAAATIMKSDAVASATGPSVTANPDKEAIVWSAAYGQPVVTPAPTTPVKAYISLAVEDSSTMTMSKTSPNGDVEGYCFKIYQWGGGSWYGKSDASGKIYVTDENYTASSKTYTFEGLTDGEYTFLEVLSKHGAGSVFPNSWKITVTDADGKTVFNKTFTGEIARDSNGDARLGVTDAKIAITGLSSGGHMTMTINNASETGDFEIIKRTLNPVTGETAAEPGAVFRYYLKSEGSYNACPADTKGTMTTGADGIAKSKVLPFGTYVVEQTAGAEGTDFVAKFEVVVSESGKTYTFTKDNPYWTGSVSIVKYEDGTEIPLQATFNLMDSEENILEAGITGEDGALDFRSKLVYGQTYYIQEVEAPEGYVLDSTLHPITVEQRDQKIVLTLENAPEEGSITVKKVDTKGNPMSGVKFRLEYSTDGKNWSPVTHREEGSPVTVGGCTSQDLTDGTLTTGTNGIATFTGLRISNQSGKVYYRLTEVSTADGSTMLAEPAFKGELPMDDSKDITITAVNSDVFELPHTGSNEMLLLQSAQLLCAVCSLSLLLLHRKKAR